MNAECTLQLYDNRQSNKLQTENKTNQRSQQITDDYVQVAVNESVRETKIYVNANNCA